ncbi:hypothetical protein Btru_069899 [Bulinus truncatus]|nr:hypothetical protein Btru_069899 [Bulinus truncatus]
MVTRDEPPETLPPETLLTRDEPPKTLVTRDEQLETLVTRDEPPETLMTRDEPPETLMTRDEPPETLVTRDEPPETLMTRDEPPEKLVIRDEPPEELVTRDEPPDEQRRKPCYCICSLFHSDILLESSKFFANTDVINLLLHVWRYACMGTLVDFFVMKNAASDDQNESDHGPCTDQSDKNVSANLINKKRKVVECAVDHTCSAHNDDQVKCKKIKVKQQAAKIKKAKETVQESTLNGPTGKKRKAEDFSEPLKRRKMCDVKPNTELFNQQSSSEQLSDAVLEVTNNRTNSGSSFTEIQKLDSDKTTCPNISIEGRIHNSRDNSHQTHSTGFAIIGEKNETSVIGIANIAEIKTNIHSFIKIIKESHKFLTNTNKRAKRCKSGERQNFLQQIDQFESKFQEIESHYVEWLTLNETTPFRQMGLLKWKFLCFKNHYFQIRKNVNEKVKHVKGTYDQKSSSENQLSNAVLKVTNNRTNW